MKKHQKHAKIVKPDGGIFHRIEIGFVGAPCPTLQDMAKSITDRLSTSVRIGYADADHGQGEEGAQHYHAVYTDKISFHRHDQPKLNYFSNRRSFSSCDAVFVNGNHFETKRNIVFLHEKKYDSLKRKIHRIGQIDAIVLGSGVEKPFDFLEEEKDLTNVPILLENNIDALTSIIEKIIEDEEPTLQGLVLMGGKSTRMGERKSHIKYYDKAQYQVVGEMLQAHCSQVHLSVQQPEEDLGDYSQISDTFTGIGPFGGILSAFRHNPNVAYFTIPCDAPLLTQAAVDHLVKHRNKQAVATCFHNAETNFPEPLITIWEPRAYPILLDYLAMGYSCPRKVLINEEIHEIKPLDENHLRNVNNQAEKNEVISKLSKITK